MSPKDFNERMKVNFENCIRIKRFDLWERYKDGKNIVVAKITYLDPMDFKLNKS